MSVHRETTRAAAGRLDTFSKKIATAAIDLTDDKTAALKKLLNDENAAEDINKLVRGFDFAGKKGVGLLFVVDGMSKAKKGANIWVTFIDMGTKKVLMTERMEGKATMAFGFRNYWANPLRDVINDIEKKKFKEWKAKYGG